MSTLRVSLQLAERAGRIAALPAKDQADLLDAIDQLTVTYASLSGVTLPPTPPRHRAAPRTDNVIPFPGNGGAE